MSPLLLRQLTNTPEDGRTVWLFILGILFHICGCVGTALGLCLQKLGHVEKKDQQSASESAVSSPANSPKNAKLKPLRNNLPRTDRNNQVGDEKARRLSAAERTALGLPDCDEEELSESLPYYKQKSWRIGLAVYMTSQILTALAFMFAAQSALAPLLPATLVANSFFAKQLLNERITKYDVRGMVLIALGAGLVVSGAPVVDPPSGDVYDDLDWLFVEYFFEPVCLFCGAIMGLVVLTTLAVVTIRKRQYKQEMKALADEQIQSHELQVGDGHGQEEGNIKGKAASSTPAAKMKSSEDKIESVVMGHTLLSGVYSGLTVTFFRCTSLLLTDVIKNERVGILADWPFYMFGFLATVTGVQMMREINRALKYGDATIVVAVNIAFSLLFQVALGQFYWQEWKKFEEAWWLVLFVSDTLGTLPGYCGLVDRHKLLGFEIEAWPQFRIGGSLWPSGALLGKWLLENKDLFLHHFCSYLELGGGVGLPSLVVAREFKPKLVTVTDYADLMPLMQRNLELNFGIGSGASCDKDNPATSTDKEGKQLTGGVIEVEEDNSAAARIIEARALDWAGCGADKYPTRRGYDVLLGADIVYAEEQDPLVNVLEGFFLNEAPRDELLSDVDQHLPVAGDHLLSVNEQAVVANTAVTNKNPPPSSSASTASSTRAFQIQIPMSEASSEFTMQEESAGDRDSTGTTTVRRPRLFLLAYRERSAADRDYLTTRVLARFQRRIGFEFGNDSDASGGGNSTTSGSGADRRGSPQAARLASKLLCDVDERPGVDEKGGQERGKSSCALEEFFRAVRERIEGTDSNEGSVRGVIEDGARLSPEEIEVQEKIEEHDQEMGRPAGRCEIYVLADFV